MIRCFSGSTEKVFRDDPLRLLRMIGICGKFTIYCSAGREFLSPELKFILGVLTNQEDAEAQKKPIKIISIFKAIA